MKLTDFSPGQKRQALRTTLHEKLKKIRGVEVAPATHVLPAGEPKLPKEYTNGKQLSASTNLRIPTKSGKKK
jgi:hypothetical protein